AASLLEALEDGNQFLDADGVPDYRSGPNIYRACGESGAANERYPKYVFKARLPGRQGQPAGIVAGFSRNAEPAEYSAFHTSVIMLCLNAMAQTLSLHVDLTLADKLMLEAREGARIDALTGIFNRMGWEAALRDALD